MEQQELVPLAEMDAAFFTDTDKLTREAFDACKQALPADVRDAFTKKGGPDFTYEDFRALQDPAAPLPAIIRHWKP